ncbi:hypothetical protein GCM10027515_26540 [Schumannella luteola]|uniref:CBM-cenC domain-containing protein n=1 Tax=Schumannella luteola TaxID=472059 RepID=A0A852YP87_9MICO|nr:carbohydrate binding domain-containing protein [Schumannella luteola]NYG99549.1 hypothetical protein [Schumannella luteola]TPX03866.1 hypothetical protein FJ656_15150 [Schumannella luteola]
MTSAIVKPTITAKVLGLNWTKAAWEEPVTVEAGHWTKQAPVPEYVLDVPAHWEVVTPAYTEHVPAMRTDFNGLETASDWPRFTSASYFYPPYDENGDPTGADPQVTYPTAAAYEGKRGALIDFDKGGGAALQFRMKTDRGNRVYRFSAWLLNMSGAATVFVEPDYNDIVLAPGVWTQVSYERSVEDIEYNYFQVNIEAAGDALIAVDAIRVDAVAYDVEHEEVRVWVPDKGHTIYHQRNDIWTPPTVLPGAKHAASAQTEVVLKVKDGSVRLDKSRAPYGEVSLTVAQPEQAALDVLDPRVNRGKRLQLTITQDWDAPNDFTQTRTFDLLFHARTTNPDTGELVLIARTDEALLIDQMIGGTSIDMTYATATDLRALVGAVLATFSATLEAGTLTSDITRTANATNLIANPAVRGGPDSWSANSSNATVTRQTSGIGTSPVPGITTFVRATFTGASATGLYYVGDSQTSGTNYLTNVQPGKVYRATVWVRASVAKVMSLRFQLRTGNNGALLPTEVGPTVNLTANTWTKITHTFQVPATATVVGTYVYQNGGSNWASGQTFDATAWMFTEATGVYDDQYFDGTTGLDTTHYVLAWTGTPDGSTSTRTRLDNRSADSLLRKPGTKVWDWLNAIVQAAGLRLFCDDKRKWRLVNNAYAVDGVIRMAQAVNLTDASDTVDLGATDPGPQGIGAVPGYADHVVVRYSWIDRATGQQMEQYDSAGTQPGLGALIEVDAPFPGSGLAAAALARAQGRGRVLDLASLSDLNTTPGNDLIATMPGIPAQVGKVASVEFDLTDSTMRVGSEGLIDTPPNAWLFALGTWSAATGSWAQATGTN